MCAFGAVARFSPCTFIRLSLRCPLPDGHRPPPAGVLPFGILFPSHSTHEELKKKKGVPDATVPRSSIQSVATRPRSPVPVAICSGMPTALLLSPLAAARRVPDTWTVVPLRPHASVPQRPEASLPVRRRRLVTSSSQSRSDTLLERVAAEYTHHA